MDEYNEHLVLDEELSSLASAAEEEDELPGSGSDGSDDGEEADMDAEEEADMDAEDDDEAVPDDLEPEDADGQSGDEGEGEDTESDADADAFPEERSPMPGSPAEASPALARPAVEGADTETDDAFELSSRDEFTPADLGFDAEALAMRSCDYVAPGEEGAEAGEEVGAVQSPPRHSKRIENRRPRSIYDENDYVLSSGRLPVFSAASTTPIVSAYDPIRSYFHSRLAEVVQQYGGEAGAVDDWTVEVSKRSGAILGGILDISYVSPAPVNKRHRSRVDALITLGLSPYSKTIKNMSRKEIADMAVENREKQLVAFQFDRLGNECAEVVRDGDEVRVAPLPPTQVAAVAEDQEGAVPLPKRPETLYFGFGNTTVLDWGRILPDEAFHTATELYPLGFKCVRQEHDIQLDRAVDCYCEILSRPVDGGASIAPLFRITVCWMLGRRGDEKCVRVYEGGTPQLAWQSAMLEQEGLGRADVEADVAKAAVKSEACTTDGESGGEGGPEAAAPAPAMEPMDEEEQALREQLMEIRRSHMKSLKNAQVNGTHSPAKPRLGLTATSSLCGDGVLRMIEGMAGVMSCSAYEYVELRSQESGFRGLTQALSNAQAYTKKMQMVVENMCERVDLLKRYPKLTDVELESGGPIPQKPVGKPPQQSGLRLDGGKSQAKSKAHAAVLLRAGPGMSALSLKKMKSIQDDVLAKRAKNTEVRLKEDEARQKRLILRNKLLIERKNRARDVERMMRNVRENTLKNTVVKRSEARLLVESACDAEESEIRVKCSPFFAEKPLWNTAYAGCIDIAKGGNTNEGNEYSAVEDLSNRSRVVNTSLDVSDLGVFRELEGDAVGALLEVWAMLFSFAETMNVQKMPSPQVFLHSLLSCDHNYIQNAVGVNKTLNRLRDLIAASPAAEAAGKKKPDVQLSDPLELLHSLLPLDTPLIHQNEAETMLSDIAIALCKMLMPDFNFWMGVDEAVGILGDLRPAVNSLTWREIARVVLTSTLMQEVKGDPINTATVLRGKGHTTAPDSFDKRTLRLSRRRICAQGGGTDTLSHAKCSLTHAVVLEESDFSGYEKNKTDFISREKYRAICGKYSTFKNVNAAGLASVCRQTTGYNGTGGQALGICVRLPTPGGCSVADKGTDKDNLGTKTPLVYSSLRNGGGTAGEPTWELALSALHRTGDYDRTAVRRVLFLAIELAVARAKKAINTKRGRECIAASRLLSELLKEESSAKELKRRALLVLDVFPKEGASEPMDVQCPVSVLEAWEYQQRMKRVPVATPIPPLDDDDASALPQFIETFEKAAGSDSVAAVVSNAQLELHDTIVTAIAGLSVEVATLRLRHLLSLHLKSIAPEFPELEEESGENENGVLPPKDDKGRFIKPDKNGEGAVLQPEVDLAQVWERERVQALPAAVQRCFDVILELMEHCLATEFNCPVNAEKYPEFYASIRHPLCFADIRQCLVENRYPTENILASFYRDVMLVLENSLAFNQETDVIANCALKIGYVFERLFFEGVLAAESSWVPEACIACRQVNCPNISVLDKTEALLCDRCDGAYHFSCLDPPLECFPRGDWYCSACTHGKQIRDVHPCVGLLVHRPASKKSSFIGFSDIGRVVDFRQIGVSNLCVDAKELRKRFSMQYVVMFPKLSKGQLFLDDRELDGVDVSGDSPSGGAAFELWTGDEVRRYCCRYATGDASRDAQDPVPALPSGYNYADYDEACTLARGYSGWSNLSPGLHPSLSGCCYLPMMALAHEDSDMAKYQRALIALSPLSCSGLLTNAPVFGFSEWMAVLQALSRRVINSQVGRDIAAAFDDEVTRTRMFSGSSISLVNLMCSLKGLFSGGPQVGEELVIRGNDDDEEGLMHALDDMSTDTDSDEEAKKPALTSQISMSSLASVTTAAKAKMPSRVALCDTDTDSEGEEGRLKERMLADEPFDEAMLAKAKDPRREWNSRRMSRRRGREDAFFTKQLLQELYAKVDAELAADVQAEKALMMDLKGSDEEFTMDYYAGRSAVFQTASRLFVNRPPDSVSHPEEWLRSWSMCHEDNLGALAAFRPSVADGEPAADCMELSDPPAAVEPPVRHTCRFCGYDEHTVGSSLVWGESREEFNAASCGSDASAKDSFPQIEAELSIIAGCLAEVFGNLEDLCNVWADHVSAQKRRKLYSSFLTALNVAGRKCAASDSLNFEKKNDIVWAPLKASFAAVEEEEIEGLASALQTVDGGGDAPLPTVRKGSVPAHECCAEYMNNLRKASAARLLKRNIVLVGELVTSVRRGKTVPIGCDSNGNVYWVLPGVRTSVFVCVPHRDGDPRAHYRKMFAGHTPLPAHFPADYCAVNRCMHDDGRRWAVGGEGLSSLPFSSSVESPFSQSYSEDVCSWRVLNGIFDIHRLMRWLKPSEFFCEKQLHVVLQLLYPEVMVVAQDVFTLAELESAASRRQTAALAKLWGELQGEPSAASSALYAAIGDVSDEALAQYRGDAMEVEEEGPEEDPASDGRGGSGEDTVSEEDEESYSEQAGSKKRRRNISAGAARTKTAARADSDSEEAEMDFSEDEAVSKRKRVDKDGSSDEGSEDPYALQGGKRVLPVRRTASAPLKPAASEKAAAKSSVGTKSRIPRGYIAPGTKVCVENSSNGLFWDGVVRKCHDFGSCGSDYSGYSGVYCYVHFIGWGAEYNSWVPVEDVQKQAPSKQALALKQFAEMRVVGSNSARSILPSMISNLKSCQFLLNGGRGRWCACNEMPGSVEGLQQVLRGIIPDMCASGNAGDDPFNWGRSMVAGGSTHKDIRLLKAAMLILEASLPEKCVDPSDERWGDADEGFTDYWRAAVVSATDASSLMECQILLEFSVRTAWLSAGGAKLLTCMPSRSHATRFATYGLVALRVFALDEAVRFELARRKPEPCAPLSDTEDEEDDDEDWAVPTLQGSSTRPNAAVSRDKSGTAGRPKSKNKRAKKRR